LSSGHKHLSATHAFIFRAVKFTVHVHKLCRIYNCLPIWIIIHHVYRLCTSFHRTVPQTTILKSDILYSLIFYFSTMNFYKKKNLRFLKWVIVTHFNYICILVLTTLKMTTGVAETCWWALCNKITSIKSG